MTWAQAFSNVGEAAAIAFVLWAFFKALEKS
jgi:hypothetical protein